MEKSELLKEVEILREEVHKLSKPETFSLVKDMYSLIFASNSAIAESVRFHKTKGIGRNKKRELELDLLRAERYYYKTFLAFVKKYNKENKK